MNRRLPWARIVLVALPLLGACIGESSSVGELGRAEFEWDEGILGCLFGCNAKEAIANRSVATLRVSNSGELPAFDVASDNAAVISFTNTGSSTLIRCEAHGVGEAKVLLYEAGTTTLIDRFRIRSRNVDRIRTNDPDLFDAQYLIEVGGDDRLYFDLEDSKGRDLRGIGGVDYAFTGGLGPSEATLTDAITDFIGTIFVGSNSEYVNVDALATGSGTLTIGAPSGAALAVPFSVVDATSVTRVEVEGTEPLMVGTTASLTADAFAGNERVHSPNCTWTLTPPTGVADIDSSTRDFVTITSVATGTVTVACTVGSVTGSAAATVR